MAKVIITSLPSGPGRENGYLPVVIAKGGTVSTIADLGGMTTLGLLVPTLDAANLTFQVSNLSDGTFYDLYDKAGANKLTLTYV